VDEIVLLRTTSEESTDVLLDFMQSNEIRLPSSAALALLLVAEFGFVLWLRAMSIREYLATRDPVSGTVYYVMLLVFAIMPLLLARR
jgi:hypothetical protein